MNAPPTKMKIVPPTRMSKKDLKIYLHVATSKVKELLFIGVENLSLKMWNLKTRDEKKHPWVEDGSHIRVWIPALRDFYNLLTKFSKF